MTTDRTHQEGGPVTKCICIGLPAIVEICFVNVGFAYVYMCERDGDDEV